MLRVSALVIAAVTAAGLYKKAWLPEKKCIRAGFFVYYTHLSNLLVLAYELALGIGGRGALRWLGSPGVALSVTLCIYVTHLIYALVLIPLAKHSNDESWLKGRYSFANVCVHYIVPGLVAVRRGCPAEELPALARRLYREGVAAIVTDAPLPRVRQARRAAMLLHADTSVLDRLPPQQPLQELIRQGMMPADAALMLTRLPAETAGQRLLGCLTVGTPAPLTRWGRDWRLLAVLDQHAAD